MAKFTQSSSSRGFTLIEVLVTIAIMAVGLLGLALLQSQSLNVQLEAQQRAQALLLLQDLANRVEANSLAARNGGYTDADGIGRFDVENCEAKATIAERDMCEWNTALKGTGVKLGSKSIGSILGATGCIQNITGSSDGEAIVRLTVAWQGMSATAAPALECGKGSFGDDDKFRRVASLDTVLANLGR